MSGTALAGALVGLVIGLTYLGWLRQRVSAPLPSEPHRFDATGARRFLGTVKIGDTSASWPRGELVVDRDVAWLRADRPGDPAVLVIERADVRAVSVQGSPLARRVIFDALRRGDIDPADVRIGLVGADPTPVLRELGWPVREG